MTVTACPMPVTTAQIYPIWTRVTGTVTTQGMPATRIPDLYFNNRCAETGGVIEVAGRAEKVCPATGILNNLILHFITAQFVDEMCRRGSVPYFWMGGYWQGGMEYNGLMGQFCRERGY